MGGGGIVLRWKEAIFNFVFKKKTEIYSPTERILMCFVGRNHHSPWNCGRISSLWHGTPCRVLPFPLPHEGNRDFCMWWTRLNMHTNTALGLSCLARVLGRMWPIHRLALGTPVSPWLTLSGGRQHTGTRFTQMPGAQTSQWGLLPMSVGGWRGVIFIVSSGYAVCPVNWAWTRPTF